ncbi:MAG: penicillin-binding protein 2 [Pseudomonadota bacterium]
MSMSITSLLGPVPRPPEKHHVRSLRLDGVHKKSFNQGRSRLMMTFFGFMMIYSIIASRLVYLAFFPETDHTARVQNDQPAAARPDLVDRNGEVIATDIRQPSLFAEPRRIIDPDDAAEQLAKIFPDLDVNDMRTKLASNKGFTWLKREITPQEQYQVHALGLPGIGFTDENRRVYPAGRMVSHVLGHVNIDNQGIAGLEKWVDKERSLSALHDAGFITGQQEPVALSLDLRVQHVLHDELEDAMKRYQSIAASGVIMNARTGEIVALTSLPDYNPNDAREALLPDRINRITTGTYEMGSTFKAFTLAMALDSGQYKLEDKVDASAPLHFGSFKISDYHGLGRKLNLTEIFVHSSNIATAKIAMAIGIQKHQDFLRKFGMMDRMHTELPENAAPQVPKNWSMISTATIAFGHGMAVAPLQAVAGTAALMNGGYLVHPTFEKRSEEEARTLAKQVIKPETSDMMRGLFRANAERGTAKKADVAGFDVGGKTGTAEKVVGGRYSKDKLMTDFMAAFPMDDPQYILLVMLDEPKRVAETGGFATAGVNAAPTAGRIISRVAPMLSIAPRLARLAGAEPASMTR